MTQKAGLDKPRTMYDISNEFRMIVPGLNDRVVSPSPECIDFYEDAFEAGIRFPLHPFFPKF